MYVSNAMTDHVFACLEYLPFSVSDIKISNVSLSKLTSQLVFNLCRLKRLLDQQDSVSYSAATYVCGCQHSHTI